jgi:hypothetical protein
MRAGPDVESLVDYDMLSGGADPDSNRHMRDGVNTLTAVSNGPDTQDAPAPREP